MKNLPIGEALKKEGYITDENILTAIEFQNEHKDMKFGQILIELGFVSDYQVLSVISKKMNLEIIDISTMEIPHEVIAVVPRKLASKYQVLPVNIHDGRLVIAINDPLDFYAIEDIRLVTGMPIELCLAEKDVINSKIDYYYAELEANQASKMDFSNEKMGGETTEFTHELQINDGDDTPIVKLLNTILMKGYSSLTSDIHIEPYETYTAVRMRIDGMLLDQMTLPPNIHSALIARTKILSGMDIAEKRIPQDGHIKARLEGIEMNLRVNVIPTMFGEKAVLRFLSTNYKIDHSGTFGMSEENYKKFSDIMSNPNGIIYITGPTGSGKTTTLYMAIGRLAENTVNIATIEDPVERALPRINQMQVNNQAGLTFESGLRALLRQDPDIIMVGETRDAETADISVRAAITGHLVVSTLHTNDAVSSIIRLRDMGVESYMIANSLAGIVAQRLVKKICPDCAYEYEADALEKMTLGIEENQPLILKKGKGCPNCNETGYKGRIAIHELFAVDKPCKKMIASGADAETIQKYLIENQGMKLLADQCKDLVLQKITTVEELLKLTYYSD